MEDNRNKEKEKERETNSIELEDIKYQESEYSEGETEYGDYSEDTEDEKDNDRYYNNNHDDEEDASTENRMLLKYLNSLDDEDFEQIYYELLPELSEDFLHDLFDSEILEERHIKSIIKKDLDKSMEIEIPSKGITPIPKRAKLSKALKSPTLKEPMPSPMQSPLTTTPSLSKQEQQKPQKQKKEPQVTTRAPISPQLLSLRSSLSSIFDPLRVSPVLLQNDTKSMNQEQRDKLNLPRYTPEDLFAADRLLAAYFRTGLSLLSNGIGFGSRLGYNSLSMVVAIIFFAAGMLIAGIGFARNHFVVRYLLLGYILPAFYFAIFMTTLTFGLAGVGFWAITTI